jgi:Uma2 family endonuclease
MSASPSKIKPAVGDPAWDVAQLFPTQGTWTEPEYLLLPGNRLVELSDGFIEVLPMPTMSHQVILLTFYRALLRFVEPDKLGTALVAPLRVRLWKGKFREPDVVFMLAKNAARMGEEYWQGADLVMEVVSGDENDRRRDLEVKPGEYARARISDYWIVDPLERRVTMLRLRGKKYVVAGEYGKGGRARSVLLDGFEVEVDRLLAVK